VLDKETDEEEFLTNINAEALRLENVTETRHVASEETIVPVDELI